MVQFLKISGKKWNNFKIFFFWKPLKNHCSTLPDFTQWLLGGPWRFIDFILQIKAWRPAADFSTEKKMNWVVPNLCRFIPESIFTKRIQLVDYKNIVFFKILTKKHEAPFKMVDHDYCWRQQTFRIVFSEKNRNANESIFL